jgi:hypothetical protein
MDHAASSFALEIRGLAKHFDGLDLTVRAGEFYMLLAPMARARRRHCG